MNSVTFFAVIILTSITTLLLGLGLFLPDANTPNPLRAHVFRLPQGARRISPKQWIWQNETVRGVFRVYTGRDSGSPPRAQAGTCCKPLNGRLFEMEDYEIEAANDGSFPPSTMVSVFSSAASTWEAIVGNWFGTLLTVSESAGLVFNGRNQIGLGALDINIPNALAVTGLWMVCPAGGSVASCGTTLKISEWDQTYAIAERDWSVVGASGAFDLPSVVVHEFGHNIGLDDLEDPDCFSSTMYGFSGTGETLRRSLDDVTKTCARDLYGITEGDAHSLRPGILLLLIGVLLL